MHAFSCTAGDYDNDGFADVALGDWDKPLLLHNEKNGRFKNVTDQAGIRSGTASPRASSFIFGLNFVDYDHDGDLDLYISGQTEYAGNQIAGQNSMWRNNGNGTFTDVS